MTVRIVGHSESPLKGASPEQLDAMLTLGQAFPELVYEVHVACCSRGFIGWEVIANRALGLFKAAREREIEVELNRMQSRFDAVGKKAGQAVAGKKPTGTLVATGQTAPPVVAAPAKAPPAPPRRSPPPPPRSWPDTARQVRHAAVHADAAKLRTAYTAAEWAEYSPMKLLGYSVGAQGLSDAARREFLADFVEQADLPTQLPEAYVAPWGKPATAARVQRTARHLGFLWHQRERQDPERYAVAISCWRRDFQFLEEHYGAMLSSREWREAAAGR